MKILKHTGWGKGTDKGMEFFAQKKMRAVPMIRSTCDPGKHRDLKKHGAEDLGNSRFPAGTGTQVRRDHRSLGTGLLRRKVRRDSQPAKGPLGAAFARTNER